MRVRTLQWEQWGRVFVTDAKIPLIMYRLDHKFDDIGYDLRAYHGWIPNPLSEPIYTGSLEDCKVFAQNHFNAYIESAFMEKD
jgi:hypothetical protein